MGSYFEFTGKVTPGTAFIFRAIETRDQARTEDRDFTVTGTRIANRHYDCTAGGERTAPCLIPIPDNSTLADTGTGAGMGRGW